VLPVYRVNHCLWQNLDVAGRHLATQNGRGVLGTTYFIHSDWLGTERARTSLTGGTSETCTSLPFGDSLSCTGTDVSPLHFTGKTRDSETELDEFPARYYSSAQGRWYSPDWASAQVPVPYADLHNPQTLNLYDYVGSDPTNHADADGHITTPGQEAQTACATNQQ
jgi:RHS repeat-associated protein